MASAVSAMYPHQHMPALSPSPHLLLIDDDEISRAVLELLLAESGFTITPAESGDDALHLLTSGPLAYPLTGILSDLQMPGLCGPDLAQALRSALSSPLPILAMSGSQPAPARLLGYDGFLLKPFTGADLSAALETALQSPIQAAVTQTSAPQTDAPAPPASSVPILDRSTFDQLMGYLRPVQQTEMLDLCFSELGKHLARMHTAVRAADHDTLRRSAHALKGSFSMIGARELQHLTGRLEERVPPLAADQTASLQQIHDAARRLAGMLSTRGFQLATDLGGPSSAPSPDDALASPPDQENL